MGYLVLAVTRYKFENDSKEEVNGAKVIYCGQYESNKDIKGFRPMTINAPYEAFKIFDKLPGVYDMNFSMTPGKDGKPQIKFIDAEFVESVELPMISE